MTTLNKFQSIEQFRSIVKAVRDTAKHREVPIPTLTFIGTVKLHGTNGGIGYRASTDELWAQSRERIITPFDDNAGFAKYVKENEENLKSYLREVCTDFQTDVAMMFGEWAGPGIQSGVAISQLEQKAFFVFQLKLDRGVKQQKTKAGEEIEIQQWEEIPRYDINFIGVPNLFDMSWFPQQHIQIDFNSPEQAQNRLVELTLAVEEQCPVAKTFGIEGIGEGIVWYNSEYNLRFKVKGEKHSTTKVRTVKQIAAVDLERMATVDAFVENVVSENRLQQGIAKLGEMGKPFDIKSTGDFIKWVQADVLKEEMDVIEASNIEKRDLMTKMAIKAKNFFVAELSKKTFDEPEVAVAE